MTKLDVAAIAAEVAADNFSDERLTKRLDKIIRAVARDPSASFPSIMSSAELEGAYRFFSNPAVDFETIIGPHFEATRTRAAREDCVRVLHDQTEFAYRKDGKRSFGKRYPGFNGHFSLVVSADEDRRPLGLAGVHIWIRGEPEETAHSYWLKQIEATSLQLGDRAKLIHVADRGAADFVLFHDLLAGDYRFVIRAGNRYTESGPGGSHVRLREILDTPMGASKRKARINRHQLEPREAMRKIHPQREGREVTLQVAAARIVLARPPGNGKAAKERLAQLPKRIELNAVRVWEPNPPEGTEPIEWFLMTNETIGSESDVWAIVDHYRARWTIEEYFKALKTGCAFEKRQLHDYEGLLNALGVLAPLACHVLALRTQARLKPDAPASTVISEDQLEVLRVAGRRELPENPSVRDVLLAIAALGGHIKYAPDPGWLTISRGLEKLELLTQGWHAGKLKPACDQR